MTSVFRMIAYAVALAIPAMIILRYGELVNGVFVSQSGPAIMHGYAAQVFGNTLSYDEVLSSRLIDRTSSPACSFVFVRLSENPPAKPPSNTLVRNRDHRFGGVWRPTPTQGVTEAVGDLIDRCEDAIVRKVAAEVVTVLSNDGAFYARDLVDGSLHVYAPSGQLAGRVRYVASRR
jgi:hypothetical protein